MDESGDIFSITWFIIYLKIHFCKLNYDLTNNMINRAKIENKELEALYKEIEKEDDLTQTN